MVERPFAWLSVKRRLAKEDDRSLRQITSAGLNNRPSTRQPKRLRDAATVLTPTAQARIKAAGQPLISHSYDLYFGWADDQIYYSELIWKVYGRGLGRRLGQLQHLRDFDLSQPAVQAKLRERHGNSLLLNETVISPVSIFNSPELVVVIKR